MLQHATLAMGFDLQLKSLDQNRKKKKKGWRNFRLSAKLGKLRQLQKAGAEELKVQN